MTVSSLTFICDMCGRKEIVDLMDTDESIRSIGTEIKFYYPKKGESNGIEVCDSCLDEIKTFINMYPKKGE